MYIIPSNKASWHGIGHRLGLLMMWVNRSFSTGEVRLTSPDPAAKPDIDFNMCSDWRDMERMILGVRMMIKLQAHPAVQRTCAQIFPVSYSDRARRYAVYNRLNEFQMAVGGALMDLAAPLRRFMVDALIADGPSIEDLADVATMKAVDRGHRARALASDLDLPDGRVRRPRRGDRSGRPGLWRLGPARLRRLDHAGGALRQHQHPDHHGRREDRRDDAW